MVELTVEAPSVRRITREQYHRMGELGLIAPDERTELLDGVIYEMAPIRPEHTWPVIHLSQRLWACAAGRPPRLGARSSGAV